MKLKYYVIFSFVFMLVIGLYVYSLESYNYTYEIPEDFQRKNDYDKLLSQINEQSLNQDIKPRVYKRKAFSNLSKILQRFYLKPRLDSTESFNRKIDTLFENYKDVMSGK